MPTLHDLIADKLEAADPEARQALMLIPLDNIDRWLADGVLSMPGAFLNWRELIHDAGRCPGSFQRLLHLLRADTQEGRRWREFSPFAGVLSAHERQAFFRQCIYSH